MRREGMSEQVRVYVRADSLTACPVRHPGLHSSRAEAASVASYKHRRLVWLCELTPDAEPFLEGFDRLAPNRHLASLVALTRDCDHAIAQIHAVGIQTSHFSESQAGRVQQLHECLITGSQCIPWGQLEQTTHAIRIQRVRQTPCCFGRTDFATRVALENLLANEEFAEAANGGEKTLNASRRQPARV